MKIFRNKIQTKTQNIDQIIYDMFSNNKLNLIVTKLIICGRKLNISLVFITKSYFAMPKNYEI